MQDGRIELKIVVGLRIEKTHVDPQSNHTANVDILMGLAHFLI